MEVFDPGFGRGRQPAFDRAPASAKCRVFGVDYLRLRGRQNGDLFVTRTGWPVVQSLLPARWFTGDSFSKPGRALAGATGAVYKVDVPHPARKDFALVVKFSRVAQDVGVTLADVWMDGGESEELESAEFLPPFEEFSHVLRLKQTARLSFPTKAPLAIYSPPTRYLDWQLGRREHLCWIYDRRLAADQEGRPNPVTYDWERIYILLYRWMTGTDAEEAARNGFISEDLLRAIGKETRGRLRGWGWKVLDHKPRHVILRTHRRTGALLFRHGRPLAGLVDYELLVPLDNQ